MHAELMVVELPVLIAQPGGDLGQAIRAGLATAAAAAVVPGVAMLVALAVAWLLRRSLPAKFAERCFLNIALAASFVTGFCLLHGWAALAPVQHWQWLAYLAMVAVLGGLTLTAGASWAQQLVVYGVLAFVAAWQLVPLWKDLQPPRYVAVPLLAGYLLLLSALLAALPDRLLGWHVASLFTASATTVALLTAIEVSLRSGHVGAVAAAALAGCCFVPLLPRPSSRASEQPAGEVSAPIRGLIPAYTVLVGGLAFVGTIEPSPPMPIILVAPAAPLMLWLFAGGPLSRLQGRSAIAARIAAVLLPLAIALAWVAMAGGADDWGE